MSAPREDAQWSVLLDLAVANALASQLFDRELTKAGYPFTQVGLLTLVDAHGPITPGDLEVETGIPKTTLRGRLQGLLAKGYVRRVDNPDDRRSHFLEVTPEGEAFLREMEPIVRRTEAVIEQELGVPLEEYREPLQRLRTAERALIGRRLSRD